ncbi:MAG: TlpA family protein disulfide reductase [Caulobacteraceae bacterium]|nr:TlpA family protein disulfide reductase [Caulobacter sp.]
MSDAPRAPETPPRPRLPARLRLAIWTTAALGAAALVYTAAGSLSNPAGSYREARGPAGVSGGFVLDQAQAAAFAPPGQPALHVIPPLTAPDKAPPAPEAVFTDAAGKPAKVADFRGKVVVLNLWATWCGPCIKEMPTLAALARSEAGKPVAVAPLSIDRAAATPKAKAFIAQNAPLRFYQDAAYAFPTAMRPPPLGFPTTLILDKRGRVRAVVSSDLDWNGEQARRVIGKLAAEPA